MPHGSGGTVPLSKCGSLGVLRPCDREQDGKVANPVDVIVRDHVAEVDMLKEAMS